MPKFNTPAVKPRPASGPLSSAPSAGTYTFNGALGFEKDAKTALYTLALTNMVSETTFYEAGKVRDKRFVDLVHGVARTDPGWLAAFLPWVRNVGNMRSAPIVAACEFVRARLAVTDADIARGDAVPLPEGVTLRKVIDSVCVRADEPAEIIGYWMNQYGRRIPKPVKRGLGDAVVRLYNERNTLKYDALSKPIRFGDVLELCHPATAAPWQSALFEHLIDRRHGRDDAKSVDDAKLLQLPVLRAAYTLDRLPVDQRRAAIRATDVSVLADAGFTWERLGGWLPGGMDAEAWELVIPTMGYMALLRNLRNFEDAKISTKAEEAVCARLVDPEQVARSRLFPFRFYSAYKATGSLTWGPALEKALNLACLNIPEMPGRTAVLIDTSRSMDAPVSGKSKVHRHQAAAFLATAFASRNEGRCDSFVFADTWAHFEPKRSVLRSLEDIDAQLGQVGSGTNTWNSVVEIVRRHGPFDRVIVFTDEQCNPHNVETTGYTGYTPDPNGPYQGGVSGRFIRYRHGHCPPVKLPDIPIYSWDLAGYAPADIDTSERNRFMLGGFSDASFALIPMLERGGADVGWPWEYGIGERLVEVEG